MRDVFPVFVFFFHLLLYSSLQEPYLGSKGPCSVGEDARSVIQATATPSPFNKSHRTESLLSSHPAAPGTVDYITVKLMYTWVDQKENLFMK